MFRQGMMRGRGCRGGPSGVANHPRGERRRVALADRLRDHLVDEVVPALELVEEAPVVRAMPRLSDDDEELLRLAAWEELE